MYANAVTSKPSLLSGLRTSGNVGAFAKGQAMQNAAGLRMDAEQKNQEMGMQRMEGESRLRQQGNQVAAQRAGNGIQERMAGEAMRNRQQVFDLGMDYDYSQAWRQRQNSLLQTLINSQARSF